MTTKQLLSKLYNKQEIIMADLFGLPSVCYTQQYSNPFRNDKNGKCKFEKTEQGIVLFKDFASDIWGNIINITQFKFECDTSTAMVYLASTYLKPEDTETVIENEEIVKSIKSNKEIIISYTPLDKPTKCCYYKTRFGLSDVELAYEGIIRARRASIQKAGSLEVIYWEDDNPLYIYEEQDGYCIYRPLETSANKFRKNTHPNNVIGLAQLSTDLLLGTFKTPLIITKSKKDVAVCRKMGFTAIAGNSENTFPQINQDLKKMGGIIIYDNDKTGIYYANKFSKLYGLPNIFMPEKDISDTVLKYGYDYTKEYLNTKINET